MASDQMTTKTIASVEKAMRVLDIVARSENGMTVTELSRELDSGVSAAFHLLNTLRRCDMLQQDPQSKRYSIGLGVFRLYALAQRQNTLAGIAQPFLDALSQNCDETSNLIILQDKEAVYVAQSESNHLVKMFTQIGARVPYYCTGGGKVILAFQPEQVRDAYARETHYIPFTQHTISDRAGLLRELDAIRECGYGFDREEREPGVLCIAAPVFNAAGISVAAMSISAPTFRLEKRGVERLTALVCQGAARFSKRLGFEDPYPALEKMSR